MDKPKKKVIESYNFFEVINYIIDKYGLSEQEKNRFWKWLRDNDFEYIHNGSYEILEVAKGLSVLSELVNDENSIFSVTQESTLNILQLLYEEYQEKEMYFCIEW